MTRRIDYSDVGAWQWLVQQWERRIAELPEDASPVQRQEFCRSLDICRSHLIRTVARALEGKR